MGEKRTSLFTLGDNEDVESSISEVANTASCKPPTMTNAKLPPAKRPLDRRRSDLASKKEAEPVMATMLKFSTPESNEQLKTDKFGVLKDFSVVTHRLIGQKIQNKMVETTTTRNLQGCLKRSSTEPSLEIPSEFLEKHQAETPKAARKPFKVPQQSGSKQPGFGDSGYGDRYTNQWDWPYPTKPIVKSTDDKFEAIIFYAPFTHEEVWARVMGTDLMITCIPKDEECEATLARFGGKPRHFSRTYQLPLNTDPRSVVFRLIKKSSQLKVFAQRLPPMKMAVAAYGAKAAEEICHKTGLDEKQLAIEAFNHLRELHIEGPVLKPTDVDD